MQGTLLPHLPVTLPHAQRISASLFHALEYSSLMVGACGGALAARRDATARYDLIGILGLGLISGVGGGMMRDIMLGDGPPLALQNPLYLALSLVGAAIAIFFGRTFGPRMNLFMLILDAAGLGLFTVAGSSRALNNGLGFLPCVLLGVTTAVGGGSLRDVFSGQAPQVFRSGEPYAIVSTGAAAVYLILTRHHMPYKQAATISILAGFSLRLLAVRLGWRTRAIDFLP